MGLGYRRRLFFNKRTSNRILKAILLKTEHKHLVQVLRNVRVLHALHGNQIDRIADLVTEVTLKEGDVAVSEGDQAESFFIVKSGTLAAKRDELRTLMSHGGLQRFVRQRDACGDGRDPHRSQPPS